MLTHLSISNYALIDNLEIDFDKGLTIITGETGAGKSIILGALSLILGERADMKVIRNTEKKSVIEATFCIREYADAETFLRRNEIDIFEDECILRREVAANGRSRAFINDTPVTLSALREFTLFLIDIHSQHSNMMLGDAAYRMNIIDSISANENLRREYRLKFREYKELKEQLTALKGNYEKSRQDEDYIRFQLSQISALKLQDNEDTELEKEQSRLSNVSEIKQCLWNAVSQIKDNDGSILSVLSSVARDFAHIENIDADLKEISERVQSSIIELKDIAGTIDGMQDSYTDNPAELERINERLGNIYDLETKHKVATVNELIALQRDYEKRLEFIDNSDDEIKSMEAELKKCEAEVLSLGKELSETRRKGSELLKSILGLTAVPLGMKNIRFDISFEETVPSDSGIDKVDFLFAFNRQQQLMPIENTASGGELSRVMLCVKTIVASRMKLPTIIFDEVDTGVSGEIAHKMGEMMKEISDNIQVITITHLPQVAVKGNQHYKVYKDDVEDSTYTSLCRLTDEERVNEIARMLSGKEIDSAAINNAKSLLGFN